MERKRKKKKKKKKDYHEAEEINVLMLKSSISTFMTYK